MPGAYIGGGNALQHGDCGPDIGGQRCRRAFWHPLRKDIARHRLFQRITAGGKGDIIGSDTPAIGAVKRFHFFGHTHVTDTQVPQITVHIDNEMLGDSLGERRIGISAMHQSPAHRMKHYGKHFKSAIKRVRHAKPRIKHPIARRLNNRRINRCCVVGAIAAL